MMNNEKMIEMMEFFEMYEMFKAMKHQTSVSARTENVQTENTNNNNNNNNNLSVNFGNLVQRGNDVVDLGENKNTADVLTKFEVYDIEIDGKKYYCIRSGMCTGKKAKDENGNEKIIKFNISAKQLANDMIKSVEGIITFDIPFENKKGKWSAWGFKTKKKALEVLETLPKVVKGEDIDRKNAEYRAKKNGGKA